MSNREIEDTYKQVFPAFTEDTIHARDLLPVPWTRRVVDLESVLVTEEFNSLCPWSGLPDFAKLTITYTPRNKVVELKSLKLYLTSFRNVGITQERAVQRISEDLVSLLDPLKLDVQAVFTVRGGIGHTVSATWKQQEALL